MQYYITFCTTFAGVQKITISSNGYVSADSKAEAYEQLFSFSFLASLFEKEYPDTLYKSFSVLFCKVW